VHISSVDRQIPGTCVQYPGLQGGGSLGDALTQGTPAGSMAASAHGGTYSHVAVVGRASGGQRDAASATAAAEAPAGVARRPQARPSLRRAAHLRTVGWRPTRRTGGRVELIAARRGACSCTARWRQQPPTRRRNRRRRAGTITRGSSWARQALEVAARGHRAQLGAVDGARGQAPSGFSDSCGRTVLLSHVTPFVFSVIATLPTLTRPQTPDDTNADCHL